MVWLQQARGIGRLATLPHRTRARSSRRSLRLPACIEVNQTAEIARANRRRNIGFAFWEPDPSCAIERASSIPGTCRRKLLPRLLDPERFRGWRRGLGRGGPSLTRALDF